MNLIQLVGDQTVQNLLPVMALRPRKIIQLRSQDAPGSKRFEQAAQNFILAAQRLKIESASASYEPEVITIVLSSCSPGIEETRVHVAKLLAEESQSVVNFTGATKLMSLGSHQAATALSAPSFYCDTQEKCFTDGQTKAGQQWPDFATTAKDLTVPLLMAAHGKDFDQWKHEQASSELKAYGLTAFGLRRQHANEMKEFTDALKPFFFSKKGKVPSAQDELTQMLSEPLPAACAQSAPCTQLLQAAGAANLVAQNGSDWFVNSEPRKQDVERVANLLLGTWLELAVIAMLERHPRYQNALWSVEPRQTQAADFGEMDIVCVDQKLASLRYLSCKTVITGQALEHLEAVGDRAHRVGGSHAASTLVLFHAFDQAQTQAIRNYAQRLRISATIGPEDIVKEFGPPGRTNRP